MKKLFLVLVLLLSGCATQTFNIQSSKSHPVYDDYQVFFLEGILQSKDIDAAFLCGGANKVAKIEVEQSLLDGILSIVTYHIYTPRNAKVYCTK